MSASRFKSWMRRLVRILSWVLVGLLLLVVGVYLFLQTGVGRNLVRGLVEKQINGSIRGRVAIGELSTLTLWTVRLEDVALFDTSERPILEVGEVLVKPDLIAIIGGEVVIDTVAISDPGVRLLLGEDGQYSLLTAVAGRGPPAPEEPEAEAEEPTVVRIDRLTMTGGSVATDDPLARGLGVADIAVDASFHMAREMVVELDRLTLTVVGADGELIRLDPLVAHLETGPGTTSRATLQLRSAADDVGAEVQFVAGSEGSPAVVDGRLELDRLTTALLEPLGLGELRESAPEWVSEEIRAAGPLDDLEVSAHLNTAGGPVDLTGRLRGPDDVAIEIGSPGLELAEVMSSLPAMRVAWSLEASMRTSHTDDSDRRSFSLRLDHARVDEREVPALEVDATLDPGALTIDRFYLPHLGGQLSLTGVVGFDGSASVDFRADQLDLGEEPTIRGLMPELAGRLDASVQAQVQQRPEPTVSADIALSLDALRLPGLSVEALSVSGTARGPLLAPEVDLDVEVAALSAGSTGVDRAGLHVHGGPERYSVNGEVQLTDGPLIALDIRSDVSPERIGVNGAVNVTMQRERLRAGLENVELEMGRAVRVGRLRLTHRDARLEVTGLYDFERGASIRSEISRLDLSMFDGRLGLPDLPLGGVVSGRASFQGQPGRPEIDVSLQWRDGRVAEVEGVDAGLTAHYGDDGVRAQARVDVAETIRFGLEATGEPAGHGDPVRALREAIYQVALDLDSQDLSLLGTLVPGAPVSGGSVSGTVTFAGTLAAPRIDAEIEASALEVAGRPPMDLRTRLQLEEGTLQADLDAADDLGPLATVSASADFGLGDLMARSSDVMGLLRDASWQLEAAIPERRADSLGVPLGPAADVPLYVALVADLRGAPGEAPRGGLRLDLRTDLQEAETVDDRCAAQEELSFSARADLESGGVLLLADARLGGVEALRLEASVVAPFDEWWREGPPSVKPPASASLTIAGLDLAGVPYVCRELSGTVAGRAELRDLFTAEPSLDVDLSTEGLAYGSFAPFGLTAQARASREAAVISARIEEATGGTAALDLRAPLAWGVDGVPSPGEGDLSAVLTLSDFATAPLAGVVGPLRRGEGTLDGELIVEGPLDALVPRGEIRLRNVGLALPGVDQRLSGVSGLIRFSPDEIAIEGIRARDLDGRIRLDGVVALTELSPTRVDITIDADTFPMRQAGTIVARLSTRATVRADMGPEGTDAEVRLEGVAVRLPEESAGSVQSLEANPDVVFVDQVAVSDEAEEGAEVEPAEAPTSRPVHISLRALSPFWVQRNDFSIQMTVELDIDADESGVRIAGPVTLRRGTLRMMTKTFELREGSIRFAGGSEIDPLLDIVAVHELARYPGETVTLTISGRLSRPTLTFACTVPGVTTEAQIVQLLVTGRVDTEERAADERSAGQQAASILSGLTAGILTLAARNELGETLPVIAVNTGEELGDVEVRAGLSADRLIPPFLRGVVTGMYVEGFVETSSETEGETTTRATTGGFLLEFYFPLGFSTSSSFQPPANWSFDFLWQP